VILRSKSSAFVFGGGGSGPSLEEEPAAKAALAETRSAKVKSPRTQKQAERLESGKP
jgi:hypothetical protein